MKQLALGVRLRDAARLEQFVPGFNSEALAQVTRAAAPHARVVLQLWGRTGAGKTHLLQGACARAAERGARAACLDLHQTPDPAVLDGWEQLDLVALDGLDAVAGDAAWNSAMFRLHVLLVEAGGSLLLASTAAPAALPFTLPDLRSRVLAAAVFQLRELTDEDQLLALQQRAARRGLELSDEAARYLVHRCPRDMHSLCELLDRLDEASLAQQRRLTVPFLRSALGDD